MTSVPGEPTAATTMTAILPVSFPSDAAHAASTGVTTDFLALVGFAARVGTCVNNDAAGGSEGQDAKSVRDEAMLLMSLLMGNKAEEILSEEIGTMESRCEKRRKKTRRSKDGDDGAGDFSFTFPSLSLQPENAGPVTGVAAGGEAEETTDAVSREEGGVGDRQGVDNDGLPPPSQLLGRTQSVNDKDAIRDSSEAMAHNVLESFGAALVWRAKTWIKSLANVLALKEQEGIDALNKAAAAKGEEGVESGDTEADQEEDQDQDEHEDEHEEGADTDVSSQEGNNENDYLMNSKEMQIIDAIVKSSEEVSVVNVKTAFRVLSNRVPQHSTSNAPMQNLDRQEPSPKKAKTSEESPQDVKEFKVTHKLVFEATISMTSNDGVRYNGVKLQAPGQIQGTFARKAGSTAEGEETLVAVSMTLDTDALALSLERQSRLVVRRAAEAALVAASGVDCSCSSRYTDSPHVHQCVISPRYVLMSPVPASSATPPPPVPSANALNEEEEPEDRNLPPPVVSSSEEHSSDSSSTLTTPPLFPIKRQSPSFPALLSVANEELSRGDS